MAAVMTTINQVIYIHGKKKWRKNTALPDTKTNIEKGEYTSSYLIHDQQLINTRAILVDKRVCATSLI